MTPKEKEREWEVECIREAVVHRRRIAQGIVSWKYFVKWKDWPEETNTWESLPNMKNSTLIIEDFWRSVRVDLRGRDRNDPRQFCVGETFPHPNLSEDDSDDTLADARKCKRTPEKHPRQSHTYMSKDSLNKKEHEWEVECIREAVVHRRRIAEGSVSWKYFVKWKDWPEETNTWEGLPNMKNSTLIIEDFWRSVRADLRGRDRNDPRQFCAGETFRPHPNLSEDDPDETLTDARKRKHIADKDSDTVHTRKKHARQSLSTPKDPLNRQRPRKRYKVSASSSLVSTSSFVALQYVGKFDVFFCGLTFLQHVFRPRAGAMLDYPALYKEILAWQSKPDSSMRLILASAPCTTSTTSQPVGRISCDQMVNPDNDKELTVYVKRAVARQVTFNADECEVSPRGDTLCVPGLQACLHVDTEDAAACGMIASSQGYIKMRKVWESNAWSSAARCGSGPPGELWEGFLKLNIVYGPELQKKGHETEQYSTTFWAVRALKDPQNRRAEVGIELVPDEQPDLQ